MVESWWRGGEAVGVRRGTVTGSLEAVTGAADSYCATQENRGCDCHSLAKHWSEKNAALHLKNTEKTDAQRSCCIAACCPMARPRRHRQSKGVELAPVVDRHGSKIDGTCSTRGQSPTVGAGRTASGARTTNCPNWMLLMRLQPLRGHIVGAVQHAAS